MKKNEKTALLGSSLGSVLLIIAGLVLLFRPDFASAAVAVVAGWVLILVGGLGILISILSWPVLGPLEMAVCILDLGLGIYVLCNPLALAIILGLGLGSWLVIQGLSALREALKLKKADYSYVPNLVLAILMMGLGLVLIFSPLTTSRVIMSLCGIAMLVCGAVNLILRARATKLLQEDQRKRRIIDADE